MPTQAEERPTQEGALEPIEELHVVRAALPGRDGEGSEVCFDHSTRRLHSSSFSGLPHINLNISPKKELPWRLWEGCLL